MLYSRAARALVHGGGRVTHKQTQPRFERVSSYGSVSGHFENVDVAIVGGGPAGLSLACALSSSANVRDALQISLIEGGDLDRVRSWSPPADQFSNRVSSVTNASIDFLKDIGAWELVDLTRTAPIEEMQVWDSLSDSRVTFSTSDMASVGGSSEVSEMGRLTENLNVQRALLHALGKNTQVSLIDKTKVETISRDDREGSGWPIVHLSNGRQLRARLLVGADGFNSPVRTYANISSYGWSYDTQAIVATMSHAPRIRTEFQNPNTTAYQRYLPTGPIAFLPLSPTTSSLVWNTKPPLAAALIASDPSVLSTMINAAFRLPEVSMRYLHKIILEAKSSGSSLNSSDIMEEVKWREQSHSIEPHSAYSSVGGALVGVPPTDADLLPPLVTSIQHGTIASFPIRFSHADQYIGEGEGGRTVLVGDAAHTINPLAGQGLNMGFADVQALARCIETAIVRGGDVGSYTSLMPYSRDRYFENHKLLSVTDKLHKLYSSTSAPVVWARSVGVDVLNELGAVKGAMILSAGGQSSRAVRHDTAAWNLIASGVQALAGGSDLAKLLVGHLGSLASSTVAGVAHLTGKPR